MLLNVTELYVYFSTPLQTYKGGNVSTVLNTLQPPLSVPPNADKRAFYDHPSCPIIYEETQHCPHNNAILWAYPLEIRKNQSCSLYLICRCVHEFESPTHSSDFPASLQMHFNTQTHLFVRRRSLAGTFEHRNNHRLESRGLSSSVDYSGVVAFAQTPFWLLKAGDRGGKLCFVSY